MSCIITRAYLIQKYNIYVDYDGKITRTLSIPIFTEKCLMLCALIVTGILAYIIHNYTFYPVTIIGNTIYSRLIATFMKIPYVICKGSNRITYYITDDDQEIPFEGASIHFFQDTDTSMIPLTSDELNLLEKHTGLKNLAHIQDTLIQSYNIVSLVNKINTFKPPIVQVKKFFGNLLYVMTNNEVWITRNIITDIVSPLHPGDTIVETQVTDSGLQHIDAHLILPDHTIKSLNSDDNYKSIIYHLKRPRPFSAGPITILHPFHLPVTRDPLLALMIIARALIS